MAQHLLDVKHLQVSFRQASGLNTQVVDDVSFYVDRGEIIGIIGESGSGKSVSLMSLVKLIQMPPGKITGGEVLLDGQDLIPMADNSQEIRAIRGKRISYIFQEPMTSLNPVLTVRKQITESIRLHLGLNKEEADKKAADLLRQVGIPDPEKRLDYYPTQFSGGMRQRVMIAMAMSSSPDILIADEATTALDVTTQEQILELLQQIVKDTQTALIIVTHNLSVVARYAQRVYIMYAGNVVEEGTTEEVFNQASHPYTKALLRAIPRLDADRNQRLIPLEGTPLNPAQKDGSCPFRPRCHYACEACQQKQMPEVRELSSTHAVRCFLTPEELIRTEQPIERFDPAEKSGKVLLDVQHVKKYFPVYQGLAKKKVADVKALDDVSLTIHEGETVGLVGESGCGKTTLSKVILHIYEADGGKIIFRGQEINGAAAKKELRKHLQFIFQDPYGSLDPRQSIGESIAEPLKAHKLCKTKAERDQRVEELMKLCGMDPTMKERFPHEFSGGQRQRVGIARALATYPDLVICDEPVSALDVSIQAQVINLLRDIQKQRGLSYLFIAHDLSVVKNISDRIVVMYMGRIVEISPSEELYENPMHPYTKALLSAIPVPDPVVEKQRKRERLEGEAPSLLNRPEGCPFSGRCPYASPECAKVMPEMREYQPGHFAACHKL